MRRHCRSSRPYKRLRSAASSSSFGVGGHGLRLIPGSLPLLSPKSLASSQRPAAVPCQDEGESERRPRAAKHQTGQVSYQHKKADISCCVGHYLGRSAGAFNPEGCKIPCASCILPAACWSTVPQFENLRKPLKSDVWERKLFEEPVPRLLFFFSGAPSGLLQD